MDDNKIVVDLDWFFGIIVIKKTGVVYTNQSGGRACKHPSEEGYFIPLKNKIYFFNDREPIDILDDLYDILVKPYNCWCCEGITKKDADLLDKAFEKAEYLGYNVQVDRSRLRDSMEAWLYVTFDGGKKGVLVWENSD